MQCRDIGDMQPVHPGARRGMRDRGRGLYLGTAAGSNLTAGASLWSQARRRACAGVVQDPESDMLYGRLRGHP